MRSILRAVPLSLALAAALAAGAAAQQPALKLGYINSQRLLQEAPGRADAQKAFEAEVSGYDSRLKKQRDELEAAMSKYQGEQASLSPSARVGRENELRVKQQQYQDSAQKYQEIAQRREAELTRPILEKIQKAIEAERAEGGYAMILDAGSQAGIVVAADKSLDLTDKVLARVKAMPNTASGTAARPAPGATGPAAAPAGVQRPKAPPQR
jgi:outer membrane protein